LSSTLNIISAKLWVKKLGKNGSSEPPIHWWNSLGIHWRYNILKSIACDSDSTRIVVTLVPGFVHSVYYISNYVFSNDHILNDLWFSPNDLIFLTASSICSINRFSLHCFTRSFTSSIKSSRVSKRPVYRYWSIILKAHGFTLTLNLIAINLQKNIK
jgi:hypothetical protein